jgi:hypothetical protein
MSEFLKNNNDPVAPYLHFGHHLVNTASIPEHGNLPDTADLRDTPILSVRGFDPEVDAGFEANVVNNSVCLHDTVNTSNVDRPDPDFQFWRRRASESKSQRKDQYGYGSSKSMLVFSLLLRPLDSGNLVVTNVGLSEKVDVMTNLKILFKFQHDNCDTRP